MWQGNGGGDTRRLVTLQPLSGNKRWCCLPAILVSNILYIHSFVLSFIHACVCVCVCVSMGACEPGNMHVEGWWPTFLFSLCAPYLVYWGCVLDSAQSWSLLQDCPLSASQTLGLQTDLHTYSAFILLLGSKACFSCYRPSTLFTETYPKPGELN